MINSLDGRPPQASSLVARLLSPKAWWVRERRGELLSNSCPTWQCSMGRSVSERVSVWVQAGPTCRWVHSLHSLVGTPSHLASLTRFSTCPCGHLGNRTVDGRAAAGRRAAWGRGQGVDPGILESRLLPLVEGRKYNISKGGQKSAAMLLSAYQPISLSAYPPIRLHTGGIELPATGQELCKQSGPRWNPRHPRSLETRQTVGDRSAQAKYRKHRFRRSLYSSIPRS